ncbi:MAG: DNA polymerase III subunit delta', partial [Lachnospiraceae bacterium]|nr:DNA polymerase III subunit delta' [Lachnospiraceae bacterium]
MANFKDIIGQDNIKKHLQEGITKGKLSHAYIINGETGSGRHLIASALTKTLLCENRTAEGDACGVCKSCMQVDTGNHPDLRFITHEKQSIGVDDIRTQLINDVTIKPYSSSHKIYIVPDANKMTEEAQNALLKTIEEPPEYAMIILLTDNYENLLETIKSRCIVLNTRPLGKEEITQYLIKNLQMEPERASIAAGFCQGNVGKAIHFASSDDFQKMKEDTLNLLKKIDEMDVTEIMTVIEELATKKGKINEYLDLMLLWFRDILMFKVTKDANILLYREEYNTISKQASKRNYEDIENIINAIDKAKIRLDANVNFKTAIELL